MKKYRDFIIETYRNGFCERFIIQAMTLLELDEKLKREYKLFRDVNCYMAIDE